MNLSSIQKGKLCVVTGATSGIGLATALAFVGAGARILGVGRDESRISTALELLGDRARASGAPEPRFELADLGSMKETTLLAERIAAEEGEVSVLLNAAGVYSARRRLTREGLELQWAVNHLSPFLLTNLLLPRIAEGGRILTISSASHYPGKIHWEDPSMEGFYLGLRAYEQTKLANVLFSYELARRLAGRRRICVFAVDPGLVNTAMGSKAGLSPSAIVWSIRRRFGDPPELPAGDIAWLASAREVEGRTGLYWKKRQPLRSSDRSYDEAEARRLWSLSAVQCRQATRRDDLAILS
jgi:NAD(P)-dependent dehydrogenase (short-subunit alcohol dehydrogenase family)